MGGGLSIESCAGFILVLGSSCNGRNYFTTSQVFLQAFFNYDRECFEFMMDMKTHVTTIEAHSKLCCILSIYLNLPISKYVNHILRLIINNSV